MTTPEPSTPDQQTEQQTQQCEERAELRRAAHDLNNLLGVILGNAELLRLASAGPAPELTAIEEACERGSAVVRRVQELGRGGPPAPAQGPGPLPLRKEPALVAGVAAPGRALVVDDEPAVLRITVRLVERCGYAVVTASSAELALAELERGPFGVVLTDLAMPGRSGAALLEEVAARWPKVAGVLMSGHPTHADAAGVQRGVQRGGQRRLQVVLRKPFTLPQLREAIELARISAAR